MKKKFLSFAFALALLLPLSVLLTGCSFDKVHYIGYLPDVFEANLRQDNAYFTKDYFVIRRTENIQGQNYLVYYGQYHYQAKSSDTETNEEWLCIWNEANGDWDYYEWTENHWIKQTNSYSQSSMRSTMNEVRKTASYMIGVDLKKSDLVNETDTYLEYKWGGKYPDTLRVSKNDYHICLYHAYNSKDGVTGYDEFTNLVLEKSTTPIPHINDFTFDA